LHAKRKFIDIEKDLQSIEIVDQINLLYQIEHKMLLDSDVGDKLQYRNEKTTPVLDKLRDKN